MKLISCTVLGCTLAAAALLLTACGKANSGSGSMSSSGMGSSTARRRRNGAHRPGILTEADGRPCTGKINRSLRRRFAGC